MKRIIIYYSLSGNTEEAVKLIAELLGIETLKIDTVKEMPKSFAAQLLIGYDEIFIGTPIWNSKGVPAINALLKDETVSKKVTGLIITSGGGEIDKCVKALKDRIPNVKYQVSLLDRKHQDYQQNEGKIKKFVEEVNN